MPWLAAVAGVAQLGGGIIGAQSAAADRDAAINAYNQSVADYMAIGVPSAEAQQIALQQYKQAGMMTPELEQAIQMQDSRLNGVSTDPQYTDASKQALSSLQDLYAKGGMTLTDQANLEKIMGDVSSQEKGSRDAILQNARARGGYGSGAALAAQLENQQHGATLEHQAGLDTAAAAQARALQAIQGAGTLGSNLQQAQFGQKAQVASAQDAINQWNAQNSAATQARNVGNLNNAQAQNLSNTQAIMNANTTLGNQQQIYNKQLLQKQFDNQLKLAQGKANARAGQATALQNAGDATAQQWKDIGEGVGTLADNYAQSTQANNQTDKESKNKTNTGLSTGWG